MTDEPCVLREMTQYAHLPLWERPAEHLGRVLSAVTDPDARGPAHTRLCFELFDLGEPREHERPLFIHGSNGKKYLNKQSQLYSTFLAIVTELAGNDWSLRRIAAACHTGWSTVRQWLAIGYEFDSRPPADEEEDDGDEPDDDQGDEP